VFSFRYKKGGYLRVGVFSFVKRIDLKRRKIINGK